MLLRAGSFLVMPRLAARAGVGFVGLWLLLGCGGGTSEGAGGSQAQGSSGSTAGSSQTQHGGATSVGGAQQGGSVGSAGAPAGGSGSAGSTANGGAISGGTSSSGGASSGGTSSGGTSSGGKSSGGTSSGGTSSGGTSSGGSGPLTAGNTFSQNRFHFGTIDGKASSAGTSMISQIDFFTSGWMQAEAFDHKSVCDETKAGAAFANLVPVQVAYISAAHVKRSDKTVCDCNVTTSPCVAANDLCHVGAQRISQDFAAIITAYKNYSSGFAGCYGTTKPIVFELEPDWYQYTGNTQTAPWTPALAGQMLGQIVTALKSSLPNARFSIDVSPWVGANGQDNGKAWYANFDMTQFTFVNTSGGGTNANTALIRNSNKMTWAGLSQVTGKPILADTGYGANGAAAGEDALWNNATNINARIADGVISISQYNPNSDWGTRISAVRGQLSALKSSP